MTEKEIVVDMRELICDIYEKLNNGQGVVMKGQGTSMLPFITDKDTLMLNKAPQKIKIGEIYLYKRCGGSYAIHRVYAVKKDFVFMLGDAQLLIEKVPKSLLVGRVSTVEKPESVIECNSFWVRFRCVVHMKRRIYKVKLKANFRRFYGIFRGFLSKIKKFFIKKDK